MEFDGLRQHDDAAGLRGHGLCGFDAQVVAALDPNLIHAVDADEELVHLEVAGTEPDERTDHDLRFILVAATEQDNACAAYLAHKIRDEGGVRDDGRVTAARAELFGEQRAAAAGLDHDGLTGLDAAGGALGDAALVLVVEGEMVADVVAGHHAGIAVLALQEALMGEHVEVLADRDLGDAERGRELRDGHASILADEIEEFRMTGVHRIRSFRQRKLPLRQAKGVFSGSDQAFSLRNFSMNSARATAPSYGIAL